MICCFRASGDGFVESCAFCNRFVDANGAVNAKGVVKPIKHKRSCLGVRLLNHAKRSSKRKDK
jgi:hypothetical protein